MKAQFSDPADTTPIHGEETPAALYSRRLLDLQRTQAAALLREKRLGISKLVLAAVTLASLIFFLQHLALIELILLPVALFILLAVLHEKLLRSIRLRARSIRFYERGLARIQDRWAGSGESGERFLDPAHPYARDLDLFGPASLFELLCTARTRAGEQTLAAWLLTAAPVPQIRQRQQAVRDLQSRDPFRESLFVLGETVRAGVHPEPLAAWGQRSPVFPERSTRLLTPLLAALWIVSLILWGVWGLGWVAAFMTVVNLSWGKRLNKRMDSAVDAAEQATQDLELLAGVLDLIDRQHFSAPMLVSLQSKLRQDGLAPAAAIRKLARIVEYLAQRRNLFFRVLDLFTFWTAILFFAAERWQRAHGPQIRAWLSAVGEIEALTALSAYAYEHPADVFPELIDLTPGSQPVFAATGLAHPLLPAAKAVRNDLMLGDGLQLILLSGPNMAGKSTFMRGIGVNAVLAQCGAPVRATVLRLSPLAVAASICVLDSLSGGISRFYAEIRRVKQISDLTLGLIPVLFLLDELLSGTNSHDRLRGTEFVVQSLVQRNAIGLVSTHDLALTKIPDQMPTRAANWHFEDQMKDGQLLFDYKLKPGIVQTSNALELMRSIGFGLQP